MEQDRMSTEHKADSLYNAIDYKDAFNHIRELANLEWNGSITVSHFRERVNDIISVISRKELKVNSKQRKESKWYFLNYKTEWAE